MPASSLSCVVLTALGLAAPEFQRLPNGLRVAVVEDRALPLVSVQLWYRVGSAVDDPHAPGLCHIARTVVENRRDAALRLRAAGVRTEAGTLQDACFFHSLLAPDLLPHVLAIEAERMRSTPTTAEELQHALAAAARRWGLNPGTGPDLLERQLLAAMFPDHPYMNPPDFVAAGWHDIAPADVDEFLRRRFTPSNAALLIVGDVDASVALELVRQHFGPLPRAEPERPPDVPLPARETVRLPSVLAELAGLDLLWLVPGAMSADSLSVSVLMHRLCNPVDGPLYRRLTELGCLPPRWRHERWRRAGVVCLAVDWDGDEAQRAPTPQRVHEIVREELQRLVDSPPTEIELLRARALAARELRRQRAAFSARAFELGWQEHVAGDILRTDFDLPYLERLPVGQVQRAAAELLETRLVVRARAVAAETAAAPASQPGSTLRPPLRASPPRQLETAAVLDLLASSCGDAPGPKSPRAPGRSSRIEVNRHVAVTIWQLPGVEWATVHTVPRTRWPHRYLPAVLLAVGSAKRSVQEYREYLSLHGLDMFPVGDLSPPGLASSGRPTLVPQMIELQADLFRTPDMRPATLERALDALWQAIIHRAMLPPENLEDEYYLPPNLIGWSETGRVMPQVVEQLEAILNVLQTVEGIDLHVAGDVDPSAVVAAARETWADWVPPRPASVPSTQASQRIESTGSTETPACPATRAAAVPTTQTTEPSQIRTVAVWAIAEDEPVSVHIADELWPTDLPPPLRTLAQETVVWLLGAPWHVPPTLDATRQWLWKCGWVEPEWLDGAMEPATDRVGPLVEAYLRQAERIAASDLPRSRMEIAARLARADRLLALEEPAAIAEYLKRGVTNPWDLLDDCSAEQLTEAARRVYRVRERSVVGSGPEDRTSEIERFGNWPPATLPARSP